MHFESGYGVRMLSGEEQPGPAVLFWAALQILVTEVQQKRSDDGDVVVLVDCVGSGSVGEVCAQCIVCWMSHLLCTLDQCHSSCCHAKLSIGHTCSCIAVNTIHYILLSCLVRIALAEWCCSLRALF